MSFSTVLAASPAWLTPTAAAALLLGFAWLGRGVAAYLGEKTQTSQAARLVDAMSASAQGIALDLLQHPPASGDVLAAVKAAAIAQEVAYVRAHLPDTVRALGIDDVAIASRIGKEVSGIELAKLPAVPAEAAEPGAAGLDALKASLEASIAAAVQAGLGAAMANMAAPAAPAAGQAIPAAAPLAAAPLAAVMPAAALPG